MKRFAFLWSSRGMEISQGESEEQDITLQPSGTNLTGGEKENVSFLVLHWPALSPLLH